METSIHPTFIVEPSIGKNLFCIGTGGFPKVGSKNPAEVKLIVEANHGGHIFDEGGRGLLDNFCGLFHSKLCQDLDKRSALMLAKHAAQGCLRDRKVVT